MNSAVSTRIRIYEFEKLGERMEKNSRLRNALIYKLKNIGKYHLKTCINLVEHKYKILK